MIQFPLWGQIRYCHDLNWKNCIYFVFYWVILFSLAVCVLVLHPVPPSQSAVPARWWWTAPRALTSCLTLPSLQKRKVGLTNTDLCIVICHDILQSLVLSGVTFCFIIIDGMVSNLRRIRLRSNSTGTRPSFRRGASRRIAHQLETPEKPRSPAGKVPKSASVSGLSLIITPGRPGNNLYKMWRKSLYICPLP